MKVIMYTIPCTCHYKVKTVVKYVSLQYCKYSGIVYKYSTKYAVNTVQYNIRID